MERRLREDRRKHRRLDQQLGGQDPNEVNCGCTAGKLRKNKVYGCPKGRRCICKIDPTPHVSVLKARVEEEDQINEYNRGETLRELRFPAAHLSEL